MRSSVWNSVKMFFCGVLLVLTVVRCDEIRWQAGQGGGSYPRPHPQEIMVDSVNYIGLLLLDAHNQNNDNNIAFSPYGATSVLVALAEGVQGSALNEILRATLLPLDVSATRVGLRDIHRHLKSYFIPQEGFLAGLTFSHENVTLNPAYEALLRFYGYDVDSFNNALYPDPHTTSTSSGTFSGTSVIPSSSPKTPDTTTSEIITNTPSILTSPEIPDTTLSSSTASSVVTNSAMTEPTIFVTVSVNPTTKENFTQSTVTFNNDGSVSINVEPTTFRSSTSVLGSSTTEDGLSFDLNEDGANTKRETDTTAADKTTASVTVVTPETSSIADSTTVSQITEELSNESSQIVESESLPSTMSVTTTTTTTKAPISEETSSESESDSPETSSQNESTEITETTTESQTTASTEETTDVTTTVDSSEVDKTVEVQEPEPSQNMILANLLTQNEVSKNPPIQPIDNILNVSTIQMLFPELVKNASQDEESSRQIDSNEVTFTTANSVEINDQDVNATASVETTTLLGGSFEDDSVKSEEVIKTRRSRSVIDYIIAKHHDRKNKAYGEFQPLQQLTFLVNGRYKESHINFMTYDTVLPFRYIPYLNALALTFPLDSSKYYLLLMLPIDELGVDDLIKNMAAINLKQIVYGLQPTRVKAVIPSFMLKGYVVLTPSMQKLGIRQIFEPRQADFTRMTNEPDIYVTNIEQAVTVTIRNYVDPETLQNHGSTRRQGPVDFVADHPFLYFVMDSEIHIALMAGKIVNPLNSRIR